MAQKRTALVVGMARSGVASARLLAQEGWRVVINDAKPQIEGLKEKLGGIEYTDALGQNPMTLLSGVDMLVLSPVIPIFQSFARKAAEMGIDVIGEIELGYRYANRDADFICVSGTNGKTTTTMLAGEIYKAAGKRTYVLGNIGIPITEQALQTRPGDCVVVEVAALQLESIESFRANCIGMLNISEDHLNRFENSMQKYIAAKCRVFENQTEQDYAVLNYDDSIVRDMACLTKAKVVYFSRTQVLDEGLFIRDGRMIWRCAGKETALIHTSELQIPGAHNVENALCAAALGLCKGLDPDAVCGALRAFQGVEHRLEFVRELGGVRYINDSKGTNPDSTIKAVEAMTQPTVLLLGVGNYDKKSDFLPLFEAFGDTVKTVIASGCNILAIERAAAQAGFENLLTCGDSLESMVNMAAKAAQPGWNVLLSPAAASWGLYEDFEHRGRVFKEIVNRL